MEPKKNLSRILDYEFLDIFSPKENPEVKYLFYELVLEDNTEGLCFFPFKDNVVLHKGDVVEYIQRSNGRLVVSLPKKKKIFVKHSNE